VLDTPCAARETCQSFVSLAKGERIRTFREPKPTITASSSSTKLLGDVARGRRPADSL